MRTVAAYASALRGQGLSLRAVAAQLEEPRLQDQARGPWSAVQVKRVLDRSRGSLQLSRQQPLISPLRKSFIDWNAPIQACIHLHPH